MGIKNLSDDELKKLIKDPKGFWADKDIRGRLLGFDDAAEKERFAKLLQSEKGLSAEDAKKAVEEEAPGGVHIDW